jgi:hypothetical protein
MKTLLKLASLFLLACEPAWAQGFIAPPASPRSDRLAPYRYFTPPAAKPGGRTQAKPARTLTIPQPETAAIGEEYAKGSIVIVNHERRLYFVEEAGRAIRYPVAIGKLDDQWEGVQTITAKRENPTGIRRRRFNGKWTSRRWCLRVIRIRSDLGHYIWAIRCTEFMERTGRAQSAARCRMAAFGYTTRISSSFTKKCKSGRTSMWCPEGRLQLPPEGHLHDGLEPLIHS